MKRIKKILIENRTKSLQAHRPAKDAPVLTEERVSDIMSFKTAYEQHIERSADTSRSVESDGFHPSALGIYSGKCARRDVYLLRGVRKNGHHSPQLMRIFANGHAVHDRIQKAFEQMGVMIETEVVIDHADPPVKGHGDGVIEWNGKKILLEIKSANESVFNTRLKWKKAKDEHFAQANIYAYILGLDTIWVMYECKNNQDYEIFEHKMNPDAAEKQFKKWRKTYQMFLDDKTPRRPYKPESQACLSCDMREHCLADPEMGE